MHELSPSAQATRYEHIEVASKGRVGIVTLSRAKSLNALNAQLSHEMLDALSVFDLDPAIGCMIVTGSERAFAAGADIAEMAAEDEATSPVVTVVAVVVLTGALLLMLRWLLKVRHNLRPKSPRCLPWKCRERVRGSAAVCGC